jgi:hypothetical protein
MSPLAALAMPPDRLGGPVPDDQIGAEPTLDDVIVRAWARLASDAIARCPVCGGGALRAEYGAHPRPVRGRCADCGSELS